MAGTPLWRVVFRGWGGRCNQQILFFFFWFWGEEHVYLVPQGPRHCRPWGREVEIKNTEDGTKEDECRSQCKK